MFGFGPVTTGIVSGPLVGTRLSEIVTADESIEPSPSTAGPSQARTISPRWAPRIGADPRFDDQRSVLADSAPAIPRLVGAKQHAVSSAEMFEGSDRHCSS